MKRDRVVVRIPKDPRTENAAFIDELPLEFVSYIDEREWKECIGQINNAFAEQDSPSLWNFLKIILILPALLRVKTYEKSMEMAINAVNSRLKGKGFKVENPVFNGYTELVITFTPSENLKS